MILRLVLAVMFVVPPAVRAQAGDAPLIPHPSSIDAIHAVASELATTQLETSPRTWHRETSTPAVLSSPTTAGTARVAVPVAVRGEASPAGIRRTSRGRAPPR